MSKEDTTKKNTRKTKSLESYQRIEFLNIPEKNSMASIAVKINGKLTNSSSVFGGDNYEIRITDCNDHIVLHGKLKNPESRRNAFKKIDTLIEVLTESRDHIEQQLKLNKLKY